MKEGRWLLSPDTTLWSSPIEGDLMRFDGLGRLKLDLRNFETQMIEGQVHLTDGSRLIVFAPDGDENDNEDDLIVLIRISFDAGSQKWLGELESEFIHWSELDPEVQAAYVLFRPTMGQPLVQH